MPRTSVAPLAAALVLPFGLAACGSGDSANSEATVPGGGALAGHDGGTSATPSAGDAGATTLAATCTDGEKDGSETGVDCGGTCATKCADGAGCTAGSDCADGVCGAGHTCSPASCSDGVKNGNEGDVDCGGSCATKCAPGKACATSADCTTACDYSGRCALAPSCVQHHGGDTCGPGPDGDPHGVLESCCTSLPLQGGDSAELDKYVITAGRMRERGRERAAPGTARARGPPRRGSTACTRPTRGSTRCCSRESPA